MTELKTLKDLDWMCTCGHEHMCKGDIYCNAITIADIKQEAINWINNLQGPGTNYPLVLENYPDDMKGSIAKKRWNDTDFRYGAEYGMLAFIKHFFNITEEDLK